MVSIEAIQAHIPVRHLPVYRAEDFRVIHGVNEGDPLGDASELIHEDVYALAEGARATRLGLTEGEARGAFRVAADSGAGRPGATVFLDALLTFMGPAGGTRDVLVFVEVDSAGSIAGIYLYALAPLPSKRGLSLVTIDTANARAKLAETATVAFTRGTRITMANGTQVPIEQLRPGEMVLTRDSGPQALRWIGLQTVRAAGPFAPIKIAAGALNNTGDLVVSPGHRLFVYQRVDALKAGRKEVLVKAGLLVNGTTVTQEPGGFVDYFQLLFDKHEIIYAEGIAAESLAVDTTTQPVLPASVAKRLGLAGAGPRSLAREISEANFAARNDVADVLRRLSAF